MEGKAGTLAINGERIEIKDWRVFRLAPFPFEQVIRDEQVRNMEKKFTERWANEMATMNTGGWDCNILQMPTCSAGYIIPKSFTGKPRVEVSELGVSVHWEGGGVYSFTPEQALQLHRVLGEKREEIQNQALKKKREELDQLEASIRSLQEKANTLRSEIRDNEIGGFPIPEEVGKALSSWCEEQALSTVPANADVAEKEIKPVGKRGYEWL